MSVAVYAAKAFRTSSSSAAMSETFLSIPAWSCDTSMFAVSRRALSALYRTSLSEMSGCRFCS